MHDLIDAPTTARVPISGGRHWAVIDADDLDRVSEHSWSLARSGNRRTLYAHRRLPNGSTQMMHNFITGLPCVDHENHDGLDNRKVNLRDGSGVSNARNQRKTTSATSSTYKGVSWRKADKSHGEGWEANIRVDGKQKYLGKFDTEVEAAQVYDTAALRYYGQFACLNFPGGSKRVIGHLPDGKPVYAIAGGSGDPEPKPDPDPKPDPEPKPTPDPKPDPDKGFPENTPVVEMTTAQQAAYYKHQSRKHEDRAAEYRQAAGGKTAAEVKADLEAADTLRREKLSADERAVEDAARKAREDTTAEFGPKSVRTAFNLLLGDMPEAERNAEIELLDLSKFLTESGDVDTAKVRTHAEKIAPAGKGGEQRIRNFGAGDRRTDKSSGVAAGRDLFRERRGKKSTTDTNSS